MNNLPSLSRDFDYGLFRPPLRASLDLPSLSRDFDYGLFRPPLRASLERVRSTLSKPATKIFNS
jgi:hypothetical protein